MSYFAHSGLKTDKSDWQRLDDHAVKVARLAAEFAAPMGLERAAHLAGLLHDLGKYTPAFQARLHGADKAVDHSTAGAAEVADLVARTPQDALMGQLIAYGILGHHAGLPDCLGPRGYEERIAGYRGDAERAIDPVWRAELRADGTGLFPTNFRENREHVHFQFAVMARMVFSCLVDADFKDTEAFYSKVEGFKKHRDWPSLSNLLPPLLSRFEAHLAGLGVSDGPINRLRSEVLEHVRAKAVEAPGLFTLTVPTGGGKTLASLGFALDHAKAHGHRRIIYAIPFTSIIDQTAQVFREVLGDDIILEHHSAIDEEAESDRTDRTSRDKLKLAMEDWAAPIVVTTNVQFFESLFAARTSRARKLHNIAGSIIVLDEAQTIPRPLLIPCLRVLDELALNYGCSIVLCTATQPAVDKNRLTGGLPLEGRELAPEPKRLSQHLRRARIERVGERSNEDLIAELRDVPQALVIVNSRKHAFELYKEAVASGLDGVIHLTTRQCAAHRRIILEDVRGRLKPERGDACRVIATSLIEAGVDVDFPRVWRAEAGLDQVIQAAGRCNREGLREVSKSLVTVFSAPDYPPPSEIKGLIGDMLRTADGETDLMSLEAIERYFSEVYWRVGAGLDGKKILEKFSMSRRGAEFEFRKAAQEFRMIESTMVSVVIPFDEAAEKAVDQMALTDIPSGYLARKLQTYLVQVPPRARDLLRSNGHVAFACPELRGDQFAVLQTPSLYCKDDVGLVWENADYLSVESLII
ncbi:MAG: CRISPR-associated helicase Cas3' [Alphaproteobacteria bacterium]|nr:CRISPR-associated helicase Cas3' [Alphaproteobacteria bacterium]